MIDLKFYHSDFFLKLKLKKLFAFENNVFKKWLNFGFLARLGAKEFF